MSTQESVSESLPPEVSLIKEIEDFYKDNYDNLVIQYSRRAGSIENAEDVVQEAFYRAMLYADSFNPQIRGFETWFNAIARRALYDLKRDNMRQGMSVLMEEALVEEATDLDGYVQKMAGEIENMIASKRNTEHRSILYLYFIREYKPSDIVAVVDTSNKTIRQIVWRFKQEVKDRYDHVRAY